MRPCLLLFAVLGCSSADNPPGTLVCKASKAPGSPTVEIAVARDQLVGTKEHAERVGKLVDCSFDSDHPKVALKSLEAPPRIPRAPPPLPPPAVDDDVGGVVGGVTSGGGVIGGSIDDPWAGLPAPPVNLPPTQFEGYRIAGDKNIVPDEATKKAIEQSGKARLIGSFKLCVTQDGMVKSVSMLRSTGFAAYDAMIQTVMQGTWRYRPYLLGGRAVEVCTAVTFIYSQRP